MKILIVVDMLNDFCHKDGALSKSIIDGKLYAQGIIEHVAARVKEYRDNGWLIIWLCDAHAVNDKEFERFPKHAVTDTWGAQIIDELGSDVAKEAAYEYVIEKTRYSGFYGTRLSKVLSIRAYQEPIYEVCGVCTSICVMDTVGGLANRDYKTVVNVKGVADFDPNAHEQALARMKNLYGADIIGG